MMNKSKRILICVFCFVVTLILIAAMIPLLVLGYNKNEDKLEVNYSNTTTATVSRTKVFYTSFSLLNSSNETFESADRYIKISIFDSNGNKVDSYITSVGVGMLLSGKTTDNFYSYSRSPLASDIEGPFTSEITFVEPVFYSIGYALIPFIILSGYGVIASAVGIARERRTKPDQNASVDAAENSENAQ